jgi:hypothetical protein
MYGDLQIDTDGAKILLHSQGGERIQSLDHGARHVVYFRSFPGKEEVRPGDVDVMTYTGSLVEVVFPVILRDKMDRPFAAELTFIFAKRETDGRWIPVAAAGYKFPKGVPLPPLRI